MTTDAKLILHLRDLMDIALKNLPNPVEEGDVGTLSLRIGNQEMSFSIRNEPDFGYVAHYSVLYKVDQKFEANTHFIRREEVACICEGELAEIEESNKLVLNDIRKISMKG